MAIEKKIESLIKGIIEKIGYQLKRKAVKDCAQVSKKLEPILEKENLFKERWFLTISSPRIK